MVELCWSGCFLGKSASLLPLENAGAPGAGSVWKGSRSVGRPPTRWEDNSSLKKFAKARGSKLSGVARDRDGSKELEGSCQDLEEHRKVVEEKESSIGELLGVISC